VKKFLALVLLTGLFSLASAQSMGYFGVYTGFPTFLGLQYTLGPTRFGVGIPDYAGLVGVSGSVDYVIGRASLTPASATGTLEGYYGVGTNLALLSPGDLYLDLHILGGLSFHPPMTGVSFFGELQFGPAFIAGSGGVATGFLPGYNARIGVNFH
jgi:hypothetical protein